MNFKFKNILLGAAGLVGVTTVALSAGCHNKTNEGGSGNEQVGSGQEKPWEKDPNYGTMDLLGVESTMANRVANSVGNISTIEPKTGNLAQFTQPVVTTIVIGHTFSQGSAQEEGLALTTKHYNDLVAQNNAAIEKYKKENPNDTYLDGFKSPVGLSAAAKPVRIQNIGQGYSNGAQDVARNMSTSNDKGFYHIVLNYAPVASTLANHNMLLSFNDDDPNLNLDLYDFADKFPNINAETEFIDKASSWILPGLKSTNVLAINAPVMDYILQTILDNGGTIKENDTKMEEFVNNVKAAAGRDKAKNDRENVVKNYGQPVTDVRSKVNNYVLSYSIFENYSDLFKFATFAGTLFQETAKGVSSKAKIFGVDSATSVYEQALYAALDGDSSKMIQKVSRDETGKVTISYSLMGNADSEAYTKSEKIYNEIANAVKAGSTKLFPGGQFSSNDQQKHRFAFSIGSTAGYLHNFVKGDYTEYIYENGATKLSFDDKKGSFDDISNNKAGYMRVYYQADATTSFTADMNKDSVVPLYKVGGYRNAIYPYNVGTVSALAGNLGYNYKFASEADQQAFAKILPNEEAFKSAAVLLLPYDASKDAEFKTKVEQAGLFGGILTNGPADGKNKNNNYIVLIFKDGVTKKAMSESAQAKLKELGFVSSKKDQGQFLGQNELISLPTPTKWTSDNKKNVVFSQGPSLIGVVSNPSDEQATKQFLKWAINSTDKFQYDPEEEAQYTAREFLQKKMSYIMPYRGFEKVSLDDAKASFIGDNAYLAVAFDQFKKVVEDNSYIIFEEPGSLTADSYRSEIDSAWKGLQDTVSSKQEMQTFAQFAEKLNK
ncbi:P68 family surface lipoprotein [Mycoplasma sp. Sp48II]|uniref:P68 family surface lipoprotein n=1 Tax=unclassified Mycoplasma TaxID=2683645 RepID=UPI003AAB9978